MALNEYAALGYKNAVAIYSTIGAQPKTYQLDEFIPASDSGNIKESIIIDMVELRLRILFFGECRATLCVVVIGEGLGV